MAIGKKTLNYYYDSNPLDGPYSQNAWGRLAAVVFQGVMAPSAFSYQYSYNQAGRVTAQKMAWRDGWSQLTDRERSRERSKAQS